MVKRIEVTDPHTGVKVKVSQGSRLAKLWANPKKAEPKSVNPKK